MIYQYSVLPLSELYCYKVYDFLENSNKIIIPQNIINDINEKYDDEIEFPLYYKFENCDFIMSYYETVIGIDAIYIPQHIFNLLKIDIGEVIPLILLKKTLIKGTKCVIQPHTSNFYTIQNYRNYLEKVFGELYSSLTENTTIQIPYFDSFLKFNIIKTEPESNISILDTDLEVDFEKALDYVEPPKLKSKGIKLNFSLNTKAALKVTNESLCKSLCDQILDHK